MLCPSDCGSLSKHVIVKYTDDTVIMGLVSNEDDITTYIHEIDHLLAIVTTTFLT